MSDIVTDRSFQLMAEQMIGEALFPTLASPTYDTFPTSRYPTSARFQGADDFAWTVWPNGNGMIRWCCLGFDGPDDWSALLFKVTLRCEIAVAQRGKKSPGVASPGAKQTVINDLYKIRECMGKQIFDSRLAYGPFGIENTTTITGQGTSPFSIVEDVAIGQETVTQKLSTGDDDNLGPNGWVGTIPVSIHILVK